MSSALSLCEPLFDAAKPYRVARASIRHFTSAPPRPLPRAANEPQSGKPPRLNNGPPVLVVDDDPEHCAYMAEVLARRGFRVAMALNGRDALRRLDHDRFEAVVTDVYMPDLDGIELVRILRERWPAMRIIAVTGGGLGLPRSVPNFLIHLGVSAILAKPFEPRELAQAVESATQGTAG